MHYAWEFFAQHNEHIKRKQVSKLYILVITGENYRKHEFNGNVFSQYWNHQSGVRISQDILESNLLDLWKQLLP